MGRIIIFLLGEIFFVGMVAMVIPVVSPSAYLPTIGMGLLLGVGVCMVAWRNFDPATGRAREAAQGKRGGVLPIVFILGPLVSQLLIAFLSREWLAVFGMGLMIGLITVTGFAIVLSIRYPPQEDT
jgi:hypothetical protein